MNGLYQTQIKIVQLDQQISWHGTWFNSVTAPVNFLVRAHKKIVWFPVSTIFLKYISEFNFPEIVAFTDNLQINLNNWQVWYKSQGQTW